MSATGARPPALRRDAVTWLVYLQVGIWGYVLYAIGPAVQLLRDETGVSKTVSGLHGTAMACGALTTGLFGVALVRRIGRGRAMWLGAAGACAAMMVFTSSTALAVTLAGAFLATLSGSFIVNSASTVLGDHHAAGSAAVSEAHATAAVIGVASPLILGAAVAAGAGWRVAVLGCIPLTLGIALALRGVRVPDHRDRLRTAPAPPGRLPAPYWWAWAAVTACVAVEFSVTMWSATLLDERVGLSAGAAAAGLTAFVAGMAVGRLAAGRIAPRVHPDRLMYAAIALTAVGLGIFWAATKPAVAVAGLVLGGTGVAFHFPIGVMRAIARSGGRPDRASARSSVGVGVAVGLGPFALGALADRWGTHDAFLVVAVLLVLASVAVWMSRDRGASTLVA